MENKKSRHVAVTIFIDEENNIAVQERGSHSKAGEELGFWGGKIEDGETKEAAMKRELQEELGFQPKEITFWSQYTYIIDDIPEHMGMKIILEVFLSPITENLMQKEALEGANIIKMHIDETIDDNRFYKGDRNALKKFKKFREEIS